jgi:membrane-bound lytic murein transglycosylase D
MKSHPRSRALALAASFALPALALATPADQADPQAQDSPAAAAAAVEEAASPAPPHSAGAGTAEDRDASGSDNGLAIYERFRQGLAEPGCDRTDARWHRHFAHAPQRLANADADTLALFAHVVDALRQAHLPTEFALIPFVESGYSPAARGSGGPAGLWQFIGVTARNHGIQVGASYDGRLSPADSTRAAVRYLKTLNGMFGGNWRLTAMAYNAGENRVLQALRRSGQSATEATPGSLGELSPVTYSYVSKLHALACVLEQAGQKPEWRVELDRPVVRLQAQALAGAADLDGWARRHGADPGLLRRLNPALASGRWPRGMSPLALVPTALQPSSAATPEAGAVPDPASQAGSEDLASMSSDPPAARSPRSHTVRKGESLWSISRQHRVSLDRLLKLNQLARDATLRPGMKLKLDN